MNTLQPHAIGTIAMGFEQGASEGNGVYVNGVEVNHQYDKSKQFLSLTREYLQLSDLTPSTTGTTDATGTTGTTDTTDITGTTDITDIDTVGVGIDAIAKSIVSGMDISDTNNTRNNPNSRIGSSNLDKSAAQSLSQSHPQSQALCVYSPLGDMTEIEVYIYIYIYIYIYRVGYLYICIALSYIHIPITLYPYISLYILIYSCTLLQLYSYACTYTPYTHLFECRLLKYSVYILI